MAIPGGRGVPWLTPAGWLMTTARKSGACPTFVKTTTELGARLVPPRDRKIIQRGMKLPGCPGKETEGYRVTAWQKFISENFDTRSGVDNDPTDKRLLELERLRLQNEKLSFELNVRKRDYSRNEDIERWAGELCYNIRRALVAMPSSMAPVVIRGNEADAEAELKRWVADTLALLATKPWKQPE